MDIMTALEKLNGFFDCLGESGCLSDEEFDLMNEVNDVIANYIISKEREGK